MAHQDRLLDAQVIHQGEAVPGVIAGRVWQRAWVALAKEGEIGHHRPVLSSHSRNLEFPVVVIAGHAMDEKHHPAGALVRVANPSALMGESMKSGGRVILACKGPGDH